MKTIARRYSLISIPCLLCVALAAHAADPEELIKYRKAVMKSQREHLAAATSIVQGKVTFQSHLSDHAKALEAMTSHIADLFPPDSNVGDTDALNTVWSDTAEFRKRAKDTAQKSAALAKTIAAGDTPSYAARLKDVQESCRSCHKDFRKEKK